MGGAKTSKSLLGRIVARMVDKAGLTQRKATELSKLMTPAVVIDTEKTVKKLVKHGVNERKAKEIAKSVVPMARNAAKKRAAIKAAKTGEEPVKELSVKEQMKKKDRAAMGEPEPIPRTDLPTIGYQGATGLDLLRVLHGLTTHNSYLVAAVKGENGILAVRRFNDNYYKVKFYPTMHFWGYTREDVASICGFDGGTYLAREWYQRMMTDKAGLDQLLSRVHSSATTMGRIKEMARRLMAVKFSTFYDAISKLSGEVRAQMSA